MIQGKDYIGVGSWGIITNDNNEILLIRRKGKVRWERPGGRVEMNESVSDALVREVKEETGIKVEIVRFVNFQEVTAFDQGEHWIDFCYHARYVKDEPRVMEPEVHAEMGWFRFDNLPELSAYTHKAIEEFLKQSAQFKNPPGR